MSCKISPISSFSRCLVHVPLSATGNFGSAAHRIAAVGSADIALAEGPRPLVADGEAAALFRCGDRALQHGAAGIERPFAGIIDRDSGNLDRSDEHTSELQSLMSISYALFCLKKKT